MIIWDKNNFKNNKYFKLNRINQMKEKEKRYFKRVMINRKNYMKIKGIQNKIILIKQVMKKLNFQAIIK